MLEIEFLSKLLFEEATVYFRVRFCFEDETVSSAEWTGIVPLDFFNDGEDF